MNYNPINDSSQINEVSYRSGYRAGYIAGVRRSNLKHGKESERDAVFSRAVAALARALEIADPKQEDISGSLYGELYLLKEFLYPARQPVHQRLKKGRVIDLSRLGHKGENGVLVKFIQHCEESLLQVWQVLTADGLLELEVSNQDVVREWGNEDA